MNRKAFFDHIRSPLFGNGLEQVQVERIESILDAWEATDYTDIRWLAYALGTAHHESMQFMHYRELGDRAYFTQLYDVTQNPRKARILGNTQVGDGARFCGRGPDMLTGRDNYQRESAKCGIDLVAQPKLAEEPHMAAERLLRNMVDGAYRKHKLADYFYGSQADWVNARNIINGGLDKANLIAEYAKNYFRALQIAVVVEPPKVLPDDEQYSVIETAGGEPLGMIENVNAVRPEPLPTLSPVRVDVSAQAWHSGWKTHLYMLGCVVLGVAGMFGYVPSMTTDAAAHLIENGLAVSGIRASLPGIVNMALTAYLRSKYA